VDPSRVDIVPSGVPLEVPALSTAPSPAPGLRAVLGLAADSFVILTAGRLEALKGQRTFVEACAFAGDLGNTRWVVAGEGPDRAFLERLARSLGVGERLIFAGALPDLPGRMHDSQVFVLASFQEGLGSALLEALAAGVPAVVAEGSGAAEVVTDGVEGFLAPVGDARSVAEAVRVLYLDPSRRKQMGSQARLRALAFSLGATVERTLASYRAALDASASSARPDA
jgi:glycosyltransferase involved in cell wall biosynthesis